MTARYMNMDTSLKVFCGEHLPEEAVLEISDKYWLITQALELVNFPFALPGTKVYKAIQARKIAMRWLELAAKRSKLAMGEGKAPSCMLDEWVNTLNDPSYKGRKEFNDREMAMVVLSFLFASQDAMSSGLIYAFQHVADHPEVAKKIRDEQERVRHGNYDAPLTLDMMDEMVYLNAVVKESMRVKPPVVMVCHLMLRVRCVLTLLHRSPTRLPRLFPSRTTTPFPLEAWSSQPSSTHYMILKYILSLRSSTLNDGLTPRDLPTRTRRTTLSSAADPIAASALTMRT